MKQLNPTEAAILNFIIEYKLKHLETPSAETLAAEVGRARCTVVTSIRRLQDFGYITRPSYGRILVKHYPNGAPFNPVLLEQVEKGHAYVLRGPMPDADFEDLRATMWLAGAILHRAEIE